MRGLRVFPIVIVSLMAGTGALALPPNEEVPPQALAAAREGLPRFLQALPAQELEHYGFGDPRELSRATLGEPFRLYTLDPQDIFDCARGRLASLPERPTNRWLFPVICDARPRTILAVADLDGAWRAIEIGGLSPAPQMQELARQWPAAQGYRLRYIQVYPGGTQFVQVAKDDMTDFVPLETTARVLGLLGAGEPYDYPLVPPDEIAAALEPIVRAGLSE
jgi:hypothetical protein